MLIIDYFKHFWEPDGGLIQNIIFLVLGFIFTVIAVGGVISIMVCGVCTLLSGIVPVPSDLDWNNGTTSADVMMGRYGCGCGGSGSEADRKGQEYRELYDDCSADLLEKEERDWEARNVTRVDDPSPASESEPDDYWQTNTYDYN